MQKIINHIKNISTHSVQLLKLQINAVPSFLSCYITDSVREKRDFSMKKNINNESVNKVKLREIKIKNLILYLN